MKNTNKFIFSKSERVEEITTLNDFRNEYLFRHLKETNSNQNQKQMYNQLQTANELSSKITINRSESRATG